MKKIYNDSQEFIDDIHEESLKDTVLSLGYLTEDDFKGSKVSCVFHGEDKTPSLQITDKFFKCYSCEAKGDIINWVELYENLNFIEAINFIAEKFNITLNTKSNSEYNDKRNKLDKEWNKYLNNMTEVINKNDGLANHISSMVKEYFPFKVGYDKNTNYIVLPFTSKTGNILGFTKRRVDYPNKRDIAKWVHSSINDSLISHCSNLFNLDKAYSEISNSGTVYVVEGPKDVAAMYRAGYYNTVSICGASNFNKKILDILGLVGKIILCLDNDDAGINSVINNINIIAKENPNLALNIDVVKLPENEDPASINKEDLIYSINEKINGIKWLMLGGSNKDIIKFAGNVKSDLLKSSIVSYVNIRFGFTSSESKEWLNANINKSTSNINKEDNNKLKLLATIGEVNDIEVTPMDISEEKARKILKLRYGYKGANTNE